MTETLFEQQPLCTQPRQSVGDDAAIGQAYFDDLSATFMAVISKDLACTNLSTWKAGGKAPLHMGEIRRLGLENRSMHKTTDLTTQDSSWNALELSTGH